MTRQTYAGRCFCGEITFHAAGDANWTAYCHCESCRRATSSPMTTWISVPKDTFRYTKGQAKYFASSPGVRRAFCGNCGAQLTYEPDALPDEVHIYAASLDEPIGVQPSRHVFAEEQLPWFEVHDQLPRYAVGSKDAEPLRIGPKSDSGQ
ncbi:MAG: GFA family protein [Pseudomonadota bacterium]